MQNRSRSLPQRKKNHLLKTAQQKGIFAIRRPVSPESHEALQHITNALRSEIKSSARLFDDQMIGITVVGLSRFSERYLLSGPPTQRIIDRVPTSHQSIEVNLGSIGIYGSNQRVKLAFDLESDLLTDEIHKFENRFERIGFPLQDDYNSDGKYIPHCSVGLFNSDFKLTLQDTKAMNRLNVLAGVGSVISQTIILDPIALP